ncbi:MAG: four helix bundle protein [Deltaproteobacteria bacterium]|nr:four helix bundle protein [Deltaproteobacteria bacterium]
MIERIEVHDRDLGRQLRRCLTSVPLNTAEGSESAGRNRQARYANAMGSARESRACLETAEALGYLDPEDLPEAVDRLDHIVAVLFKLRR